MKVLVLGGTGAIGEHLVKSLAEKSAEVFVTSRSNHSSDKTIAYIQGNAKDLNLLNDLLKTRYDAIVDFMVYSTTEFQERFNLFLNTTNQYVFLSSARVYADEDAVITENSSRLLDVCKDEEYLNTDEYALSKARQEDILKNTGRKNWTIIRPYITYAENRLQLGVLEKEEWLYRALQGKTIVFSEDIYKKQTTLTYGSDVSKGMAAVIGNEKALGETFHITQNESKTWGDILENVYLPVLEKHLGRKPNVLLLDKEKFIKIRGGKWQFLYDRMFDRIFDNSRISQFIDTRKFVKIENGLQNCLNAFLQKPKYNDINWVEMAKMDKHAGEFSLRTELKYVKQKFKSLFHKIFK